MLSLVAYYGAKPAALAELIQTLQQELTDKLGENFLPYALEQVHATIIGCEGTRDDRGIINHWFASLREETRYIDFTGLIDYLQQTPHLPLEITFSGYQPERDYGFLSRQQHPRDRSFSIQVVKSQTSTNQTTKNQNPTEPTGIPVLLGWSMENELITQAIDTLRRDCQQFNLLHKYHAKPEDLDNDLYLRLGTIKGIEPRELNAINQQIICQLQQAIPTRISLSKDDLAIVNYQELSLPTSSTKVHKLQNLRENPERLVG